MGLRRFFSVSKFDHESQYLVFERARKTQQNVQAIYREHVRLSKKEVNAEGLFQARLFASNFCLCAMTMALGEEKHSDAEKVYLALLEEAAKKTGLSQSQRKELSTELLREQSHALVQEQKNAGSAQFTLITLYVSALERSIGSLDSAAPNFPEPVMNVLGQVVGDLMKEWVLLYEELSGKAVHTYDEGFERTERDSRLLGE